MHRRLGLPPIGRSLTQLRTHPLRTLLTLLGIVFGVGSVVAMVSIGEGAQREILASIEAMGARNVHIRARDVKEGEIGEIVNRSAGLSVADVAAIRQVIPSVSAAAWRSIYAPKVSDLPVPAHELRVVGVSPSLPRVHNLRIAVGRALSTPDHEHARPVVLLGDRVARRAYGPHVEAAVSQWIRIDYHYFYIAGVLQPARGSLKGDLPVDPEIYDRAILMPRSTLHSALIPPKVFGDLDLATIEVATMADTLPTKHAIAAIVEGLHDGVRDYDIVAPEELLRQRKAAQSVLNTVLICIAAISLIVGGIGVMNIMLANIMERIAEIGLRRAIGARKRDIRNQFMMEALLICVTGGAMGIALGLSLSFIVARTAELPVAFAWTSVGLSFGISLLVGLVFGIVPAIRAAQINPIEALRSE